MGLFELSGQVRKIVALAAGAIFVLVLLWLVWVGFNAIYKALFPPEPPIPVALFGKLARPPLPKTKVDFSNTVFNIDLPEGNLPSTPEGLAVYPIPGPSGTLTSLDEANKKVKVLGFRERPKKLSEVNYLWTTSDNKAKSLRMNIATGEFFFKYDHLKDPLILKGVFKIREEDAIKAAKRFLNRLRTFPEELDNELTQVRFYKQTGKKRRGATSFSEANIVEVLFYRKPIQGKYPFVQQVPKSSFVRVVLGAGQNVDTGVAEAEFVFWNIDLKNPSSYPLRTSLGAWEDFQKGKASFVLGATKQFDEIFLGEVTIGYFETKSYQAHLQPVYVFTGSGTYKGKLVDFVAYLPAVSEEHLKSEPIIKK